MQSTAALASRAGASRSRPPQPDARHLTKALKTERATNAHLAHTTENLRRTISQLQARLAAAEGLRGRADESDKKEARSRLKVKELSYTNQKLTNEIARLKGEAAGRGKKTKASLNGLKSALVTVEEVVRERAVAARKYLGQLQVRGCEKRATNEASRGRSCSRRWAMSHKRLQHFVASLLAHESPLYVVFPNARVLVSSSPQ